MTIKPCFKCGEEKEISIEVTNIDNTNIVVELVCKNCLSKVTIAGKYFFTPFKG